MTDDPADVLRAALVAAYRPHLERRLDGLGAIALPGIADAVSTGERWLDAALAVLLARPFPTQPRSPLEVFQEAMRFPTEVLEAAGVLPASRDPVAEAALAGDRYHLAPASSQDLGEEAWRAHLAWGLAKARALARPMAGLLSTEPADRSRVEEAVAGAGFRLEEWGTLEQVIRSTAGSGPPAVAFVDLGHPESDGAIRALAGSGVKVVAYGAGLDDLGAARARSLGAADAVPAGLFLRSVARWLPTLA